MYDDGTEAEGWSSWFIMMALRRIEAEGWGSWFVTKAERLMA